MRPPRSLLYLRLMLGGLPPVSPGRLLMPAAFIGAWTGLRAAGLAEATAFVWSAVLAQAIQVWAGLPTTVNRHSLTFGGAGPATRASVAVLFAVLAFQVWWGEPWMSQRMVSLYCALHAAMMCLGVLGDCDVLSRFAPVRDGATVPLAFRRHLLKLYAFVALMVLAVNETLLAVDAPLSVRVAVLALLPIALHYFFQIALVLTSPSPDEGDA